MASIAFSTDTDRGEARFFFIMACVMGATIVGGFAFNIVAGRSSFASPLVVHFHAVVMMGWVALYLAQNALVFADNLALHRRLGWLAVIWLPMVVASGLLITRFTMQTRGGPPFMDQNEFLISNPLMLLTFGGMAAAAIVVRKHTGWHRRLMFCAFSLLTGPGLGRLLPMPLLIPWAWWASIAIPLIFPIIGALADKRRYGRAHPLWAWFVVGIVMLQIAADLLAYSPWGYQLTEWFLAGTPGAERPMEAFLAPM